MNYANALRKIAKDLRDAAEEPVIDRSAVNLALRRIDAQAEMMEIDASIVPEAEPAK
ncbi:hypothetical protein [Qipengyuania sp. MTN3-11]|uniref:hypothetical protein n=1 Tax=Qipengyuania sp. MTN3-11 TaxID=3056557 RepID=UPI0036F266FF